MEEAVETGLMSDGCLSSVFTRRSWTDLLSFFSSGRQDPVTVKNRLSLCKAFPLRLSSHLSAPLSNVVNYKSFKVATEGFITVINPLLLLLLD